MAKNYKVKEINAKIQKVKNELNELNVDRAEMIEDIFRAIVSGQNMVIVGVPGSTKSRLAKLLFDRINFDRDERFIVQFSRELDSSEVFGPVSLAALEQGRNEVEYQGYIPTAKLAFIDEVWKGSETVNLGTLRILEEREFKNGKDWIQCPLWTVIAASNEWPESDALAAQFDRFVIKHTVDYLQKGSNGNDSDFMSMLKMKREEKKVSQTILDKDEIEHLRKMVKQVKIPDEILSALEMIAMKLESEGIIISDRRWCKTFPVLQANAILNNRAHVELNDLQVLSSVFWNNPEEKGKAIAILKTVRDPFEKELEDFEDEATAYRANIKKAEKDTGESAGEALKALTGMNRIAERVIGIVRELRKQNKDISKPAETLEKIEKVRDKIKDISLGLINADVLEDE